MTYTVLTDHIVVSGYLTFWWWVKIGATSLWGRTFLFMNLFSSWYTWKIAELALNNNCSLSHFCDLSIKTNRYSYWFYKLTMHKKLMINVILEWSYIFHWFSPYQVHPVDPGHHFASIIHVSICISHFNLLLKKNN